MNMDNPQGLLLLRMNRILVLRGPVLGPADKVEVKKNEIQEKFPSMEYGMGGVRNAYVRST